MPPIKLKTRQEILDEINHNFDVQYNDGIKSLLRVLGAIFLLVSIFYFIFR